jgi:hypothetical protein
MALRVAVANGNWSNPAIWNNGLLPVAGDVVASNNFTVTIDQNVNVSLLTNTVQSPVIITPAMTSNTTPSGIVTASGIFQAGFPAWAAFDRSFPNWLSNLPTGWLAYEFTTPKVVQIYQMQPAGNNAPGSAPRNWTFEAWNGTSWVVLDTVTGNSGTATVSRTISNTTAYIQYRINITLNNGDGSYTGVTELRMYEANDYTINSVAGGGFILNSGVTCTLTSSSGIISGPSVCLTYSASSGLSTINGNLFGSTTTDVQAINYTGGADLVINGTLASSFRYWGMTKSGTGTLTVIGNVSVTSGNNNNRALVNTGIGTINITGNVTGQIGGIGHGIGIQNSAICSINITGNIFAGIGGPLNLSTGISNSANATINVTGNVYSNVNNAGINSAGSNHFLNIIGIISSNFQNSNSNNSPAVVSTSSLAINLFSGPFICSEYGFFPYNVVRMHLIPSAASYIEFRDETTGGAFAPVPPAPPTQLISPSTLVSNLAITDVRFGTVYAMGTLTGTLRMPSANQVTFGVAVDDTFGNSVLTAASVWDYLVSNITVENSIGMRLKNVATPQSVGEQLEAFLRLD